VFLPAHKERRRKREKDDMNGAETKINSALARPFQLTHPTAKESIEMKNHPRHARDSNPIQNPLFSV
jgi:hypothetical protein